MIRFKNAVLRSRIYLDPIRVWKGIPFGFGSTKLLESIESSVFLWDELDKCSACSFCWNDSSWLRTIWGLCTVQGRWYQDQSPQDIQPVWWGLIGGGLRIGSNNSNSSCTVVACCGIRSSCGSYSRSNNNLSPTVWNPNTVAVSFHNMCRQRTIAEDSPSKNHHRKGTLTVNGWPAIVTSDQCTLPKKEQNFREDDIYYRLCYLVAKNGVWIDV